MNNSPLGRLPAELRKAIYAYTDPLDPLQNRLSITAIACLRDGHERKLFDAFPEHTIILNNTPRGLQPCSRQWTTPHPFALMQISRQVRVETRRMFYAANPCVLTLDQPGRFRARALLACFANLRRWLLDLDAESFGKTPLRLIVRVATAFDGASAQQAELYVSVLTGLQRMAGRYNLDVMFQFRVEAAEKVARVCLPFGDRVKCCAEIDEAVDIVGTSAELVRLFEGGRPACSRLLVSLERCEGILGVMGRRIEEIREGKEAGGRECWGGKRARELMRGSEGENRTTAGHCRCSWCFPLR